MSTISPEPPASITPRFSLIIGADSLLIRRSGAGRMTLEPFAAGPKSPASVC